MQRNLIEQPLFDMDQIALLRDAVGDEDLRAMLSELPSAAEQACQKIKAAVASDDLEGARRLAHALKGVASSFAAARLAAIAHEFELEASSIAAMLERMPDLENAVGQTVAGLADAAGSS